MTKTNVEGELLCIGVDPTKVIIEPAKKSYTIEAETFVSMYSRELKKDFWFWDINTRTLYVLESCWKDRKQYKLLPDASGSGKTYRIPLDKFLTYAQYEEKLKEAINKGELQHQVYGNGVQGTQKTVVQQVVLKGGNPTRVMPITESIPVPVTEPLASITVEEQIKFMEELTGHERSLLKLRGRFGGSQATVDHCEAILQSLLLLKQISQIV